MQIDHRDSQQNELGYLISNCLIRKAAFEAVKASSNITLMTSVEISKISTDNESARLTLNTGEVIEAQLIVAADSRFSETRRAMGIAASQPDFGKTMMVCVMEHDVSHQHVAWEWFDYGQTLTLLPMNGMRSSAVITLPAHDIQCLMAMTEDAFNQAVEVRFKHRLGAMRLVSTRHVYPLVSVYSDRFVALRFALVGDATVGMHPVTAHGFNFGLRGAESLAREIKAAYTRGRNIASADLLARYEKTHQRAIRPLFLATHAIAKLYSNDALPARLIRRASLHLGNRISPFKRVVANMLTEVN